MFNPLIHRIAQQLVDVIIDDIKHTPGGYTYWTNLPCKGRKSARCLRKKWRNTLLTHLQNTPMHQAMLQACLTKDGVPDTRGIALFKWLEKYVYGKAERLYKEWTERHKQV